MVVREISVREIEHLGENLNDKFRSESMRGGKSEQVVLRSIMELKYKDERRFQREVKKGKNEARKLLEQESDSKCNFKKVISKINGEARRWRKIERNKFSKKLEHLNKLKEE